MMPLGRALRRAIIVGALVAATCLSIWEGAFSRMKAVDTENSPIGTAALKLTKRGHSYDNVEFTKTDKITLVFPSVCAEREQGLLDRTEMMSPYELARTRFWLKVARIACFGGHVSDALALYDRIESPGPVLANGPR